MALTVIARKPAYLSMNPGAPAEAIAAGMRSKLKGALAKTKPGQLGISIAGLAGELDAIPAYEDILVLPKGEKEIQKTMIGEYLAGGATQTTGAGRQRTGYTNEQFLTPTRTTVQQAGRRWIAKRLGLKSPRENTSPQVDQKRGRASTVMNRPKQRLRARHAVAYETYYRKNRKFRRGPYYAY